MNGTASKPLETIHTFKKTPMTKNLPTPTRNKKMNVLDPNF